MPDTRTIKLLKPAKHTTISYEGEVLRQEPGHILLKARWERERLELGYLTFEPGDRFYEHYYTGKYFTIFEVRSAEGRLKGWYCNIARPAEIHEDAVISEDLELDLFVSPDRQTILTLDEDEFAARALDAPTRLAARAALAELREMARRGQPPFNKPDALSSSMSLPADLGFAMPAEWQPHAATHLAWPFDDALWLGYLEGVRLEFTQLVAAIARFEPVVLHVRDEEAESDARRRLTRAEANFSNICFHQLPLNDVWFRDNGPLFVRNAAGVALTDWTFNAWGGKYHPWDADDRAPQAVAERLGMKRFRGPLVLEGGALELNAAGVCLTTRSCLLNANRNPGLGQANIEGILSAYLGVKRVVWLERGLEGDHTDGHIDTLARFTDDRTLVCAIEEDEDDPNFEVTRENLETLRTLRDGAGKLYRVIELPLPEKRMELEGVRLPLTYANFYIGNGFVLVPLYDDVNDERALDILRPLFPDRKVTGLPAQNLITGGGAFHCVTQQQPQGKVYRG